jgi:glycosyltransferase involved in cell wall biosynthesis
MDKPAISVLVATWNRADVIGKAIQSVCDQSFQDWELIVVSDGSTDATDGVVAQWQKKDKRIKYLSIGHAGKIAAVSNAGLRGALGEFVAILDDDDWWIDREKLEKQISFFRTHHDYVACGGGFVVVDANGKETGRVLKPETDVAIRSIALSANPIANSSSMFRRSVAGQYDESLELADWDFWLTIGKKGKLYNFPEYFLAYRMWDEGISFKKQPALAEAAVRIVRRHKGYYPGFARAIVVARLYWCYAKLPFFIRKDLNNMLSKVKKQMFS